MAAPAMCLADFFRSEERWPPCPSPESLSISVQVKSVTQDTPYHSTGLRVASRRTTEINKVPGGPAQNCQGSHCASSSILGPGGRGSAESCPGSDGDPHCVHLVLESQQAVGNAFLVARQPHPNPLDVTVGGGGGRLMGWHRRGARAGQGEAGS